LIEGAVVAPESAGPILGEATATPAYFPVSVTKLVVMSLCTLSVYEFYWFYKNWWYVKDREKTRINPVLRAVFRYFTCYFLFSKIRATAGQHQIPVVVPAGPVALGWIVVSLLVRLPEPYFLISLLAVFLLVPVQVAVNRINGRIAPGHDRNSRFTGLNIATIVLGGLFLVAGVLAYVLPEQ
jgi:hypothetical protein